MIAAPSAYLEGLSSFPRNVEVVLRVGQANLDTEEVDGSNPFGPTICFNRLEPSPIFSVPVFIRAVLTDILDFAARVVATSAQAPYRP